MPPPGAVQARNTGSAEALGCRVFRALANHDAVLDVVDPWELRRGTLAVVLAGGRGSRLAELGENLVVRRFVRYAVGEEI